MRWIKIYDSFLEWGWHTRPEMVSLFVHLLLLANTRDKEFEGVLVRRGQLLTSLRTLSKKTGLSVQSTRTFLTHLEETGEITKKSTHTLTHAATLITICKYESYQAKDTPANTDSNKSLTQHQHKPNTSLTQTLEYKKERIEDNNSSCYCLNNNSLPSAPALTREGEGFSFWSLPVEQQQQEQQVFFDIFFFGNCRNVAAEVKRFIATNERHQWQNKGRTECYSTPAQRKALAELWKPASKNPRIPSPAFLTMWRKLYDLAKETDGDVAALMLDERVTVGNISDGRVFFVCHQKFWDWMVDPARKMQTRAIINTFTTKTIHPNIIY